MIINGTKLQCVIACLKYEILGSVFVLLQTLHQRHSLYFLSVSKYNAN